MTTHTKINLLLFCRNERQIGRGLLQSKRHRNSVFLVTKQWEDGAEVCQHDFYESLERYVICLLCVKKSNVKNYMFTFRIKIFNYLHKNDFSHPLLRFVHLMIVRDDIMVTRDDVMITRDDVIVTRDDV